MSVLGEISLQATLRCYFVGQTRTDRAATDEVHRDKGAAKDSGRYVKQLFKNDELNEMLGVQRQAREVHRSLTLPYQGEARLLVTPLYERYTGKMGTLVSTFNDLREQITATNWEEICRAQSARLNALFSPEDYPTHLQFQRQCRVLTFFQPVPDVDQFSDRLGLDSYMDSIRESSKEAYTTALSDGVTELKTRIAEVVQRTLNVVTKEEPRVHDSLLEAITEIVEVAEHLNITGDESVDTAIESMRGLADSVRRRRFEEAKQVCEAVTAQTGEQP